MTTMVVGMVGAVMTQGWRGCRPRDREVIKWPRIGGSIIASGIRLRSELITIQKRAGCAFVVHM